ncbi:MAG: Na+/H+ antiporter NhaC [Gammaproteobacteria bacterium]|nr:Na+/H+ antiporter NhaC [Gammaproteobacteria bacterium]
MSQSNVDESSEKLPSALISSIPIVALMGLMLLNLSLGDDYIPTETVLIICAVLAGLIAFFHVGKSYKEIEVGILHSINLAMPALLIIFVVGALISVWIMSGIVPMLIYYGLAIINPTAFLFVSCVMCAVVSICTGSSWSTVGTIGLALMAMGATLGIPDGMTAGSIISGAYFGDKMSPMSDTTNLAPAMVGTDVITHIRHMFYTSGPAMIISLLIFVVMGLFYQSGVLDGAQIKLVQSVLDENFNVSPWLLIAPVLVVTLVARGLPAMPALILGTGLGVVAVPVFQWALLERVLDGNVTLTGVYSYTLNTIATGFTIETDNAMIDRLLNRGGMTSMFGVNFIAIAAMVFAGILESSGMLQALTQTVIKGVRGIGSLVAATLGTCIFVNCAAANQTMAIIIPARMFAASYRKFGLHPKNLSRACEDAGTVTAPLIPWNTNGVYCAGVLGVATTTYAPFAIFCLVSPFISAALGFADKTMTRIDADGQRDQDAVNAKNVVEGN